MPKVRTLTYLLMDQTRAKGAFMSSNEVRFQLMQPPITSIQVTLRENSSHSREWTLSRNLSGASPTILRGDPKPKGQINLSCELCPPFPFLSSLAAGKGSIPYSGSSRYCSLFPLFLSCVVRTRCGRPSSSSGSSTQK